MDDAKTFLLKIQKLKAATLPMDRLADYMKHFAVLLGQNQKVHFQDLIEGSAKLQARVEFDALPEVNFRVRQVAHGDAPSEAMRAAAELDRLLANDNTSGEIIRLNPEEEVMIQFPGATREVEPVYGPITQATTLDGVVIRVGGRRDEIPVHIQTRDRLESHCFATRTLAQEFGKYLFGQELRFFGDGRWLRNEQGRWILQKFTITNYEPLTPVTISEALVDLRSVETRDWEGNEPWKDLALFRNDESE